MGEIWYLWEKKKKMKKIIAKINPITGNKWWSMMANMCAAGCSEIEAYKLILDPLYFEREYLQNPKIKNEMETEKNLNEKKYWAIAWREPYEKELTYLSKLGGYTKVVNEAYKFESEPNLNILTMNGRLNLLGGYTVRVTEPIYKDGDILAANSGNVFIFDKYDNIEDSVYDKAFLWCHGGLSIDDTPTGSFNYISGFATESQKQRLFSALAKEGKRWNAEKKVVEDISKPGNISFSVKLSQESVDLLMGEIDKIREHLSDSKKKSEELIEGLKNFGKGSMSAEDRFAKMIKDDYEIESYRYGDPRSVCVDSVSQPTALFKSDNLIVTYKPRHK